MAGAGNRLRGLRIAVLGSGRAAKAFSAALARRGARISSWSRRSRRTSADVAAGADLVLFCVRDDAIEEVAERLASGWTRASGRAPAALHLSGFHGDRPLRALARKGWSTGSLHPLVPLLGRRSAADLAGAWFATSARGRSLALARRVIAGLGGRELRLRPGERRKHAWHLACALVANGAVALFDLGLEQAGDRAAPALASMLGKIARRLERGPRAALTGPVARGEREVVAGHLYLLRGSRDDALLYRLLARRQLALSRLDAQSRRAIARLLR
jgi:predicted short-subunit dehydrogenase-like oxidoreductase (DUF2520 family)